MRSRRLGAWLAVTVVVALVAPGARPGATRGVERDALTQLAVALGTSRWGEARLVGLEHAPLAPDREARPGASDPSALARASNAIEHDARAVPGPRTMRHLAALRLAEGKPDEAVKLLEDQRQHTPGDAAVLSDLAAAHLVAAAADVPRGLASAALALERAEEALALEPELPAARFNRALALERLFLWHAARAEWQAVSEREPASGWADEARARLERLRQTTEDERWQDARQALERAAAAGDAEAVGALGARFPDRARVLAYESLLPEWARAVERAELVEAERRLTALEALGRSLSSETGDHLLADTLASLRAALDARDDGRLARLARAHRLYGEARAHYARRAVAESRAALEPAHALLRAEHSPLAEVAAWAIGVCLWRSEPARAAAALEELLAQVGDRPYPHVKGLAGRLLGLARLEKQDTLGALRAYREALPVARAARDVDTLMGLWQTIDEALEYLGESDQAWHARFEALRLLPEWGTGARAEVTLDQAATAALRAGWPRVALRFFDEYARLADQRASPVGRVVAHARRAQVRDRLGDATGAARDLAASRDALPAIPDTALAAASEAELWLVEGHLLARSDPARAGASLMRARDVLAHSGHVWRVANIDMALAHVALLRGRGDEAAQLFERALRGYETEPRVAAGGAVDDFALGHVRDALAALIEHEALERGRFPEALDYAERGRARVTLDARGAATGETARAPLAAREIASRLPRGTAVIVYAHLPQGLLAWRLRRGKPVEGWRLAIDAAQIEASLRVLASWRADQASDAALAFLGKALLKPALDGVGRHETLVFVPDGRLHDVPFAALRAPGTGRALIDDHSVSLAPSASLYVHALERDRVLAGGAAGPGLIVADPAFDRAQFPDLDALAGALDEGQDLARRAPEATLLTGAQATPRRVLELLPQAGWLHFGAHARVDPTDPRRSALLLAPQPDARGDEAAGLLSAGALRAARLTRCRLVVLGACSSGSGRVSRSEGVASLARAFLERGAPVVVATRRAVGDAESQALATAFYDALEAGLLVPEALRRAQLARRAAQPGSLAWAAFEAVGASSAPLWPTPGRALPIAARSD